MKKILYTLIGILILFGVYSFVQLAKTTKENKENKKELKHYKDKTIELIKINDSLILNNFDLKDSINKTELEVDEIEKYQEESSNEAREWRKMYLDLKKIVPETKDDSLEVAGEMVDVLVGENKALTETVSKCDSAKVLQTRVIRDLKLVIVNKDQIIANQENIIQIQIKEINFYKGEVKEQKRKKFKSFSKGVGVGAVVIGILILI